MRRKANRKRMASQQNSRKGHTFIMNFLRNMARVTKNIRVVTNNRPGTATPETKRHFAIGLVSCLETFFRDMFIYCLEKDPNLLALYWNDRRIDDREATSSAQESRATLLTDEINFQNLNEIDQAFRHIFTGKGTLSQRLSSLEAIVAIPSRADKGLATLRLPSDWSTVFDRLLRLRHQLVHDANFEPEIPPEDLCMFEGYVLWVAQFLDFIIAPIIPDHPVIVNQDGVQVMFLVEDLISEDWTVVE